MDAPARHRRARAQRGVATLLILLLVALAVAVTVLAVAYSLRGTQQRQLTVHSATAAQGAAWRAVEVLRSGLVQVDGATMEGWSRGDASLWDDLDGAVIPAGSAASFGTGGSGGSAAPLSSANWDDPAIPGLCGASPARGSIDVAGLGGLGVESARLVEVCRKGGAPGTYRVTARVTGTAGEGTALTTATVEAVYEVNAGTGSSGGTCASLPPAGLVFNGDVNISGGSLGVTDGGSSDYANIAVGGDLTVSGSSSARVSGCAKGNITLGGGGITENGYLFAEGDISVSNMSPPSGTTFWGRSITLDASSSSAQYSALKAGAYAATVMVDGQVVGTTHVGGTLIASTAGGGLPWTTGTVVPGTESATFVVELTDGSQFLLDPRELTINATTGVVSGAAAVAEPLEGEGEMPDRFTLQAGSIFGGAISAQGLARTGQVWGHQVTVGLANGGITGGVNIGRLWSNGHLEIGTGTIDSLIGGGDLWARAGGRSSPVSHWNFPRAASGRIAGRVFYDASRTQLPADESMAAIGILSGQAGTSPGLPGIPYCDARVKAVDVAPLKGQANYVFEMQGGVPMLTIQNVRTASGVSLDGSYNLATGDVRRLPTGTGAPFMTCNWQTDPNSAQAHCFRNTTVASGWNITGLVSFPPGVAWFDGPVTVDGTQNGRDLVNTIIATGRVNLTEAGHGDLVAPNFSTPQVVCGGDFWPTNLCDKSSGTPRFATWTDEEGQVHVGLPIGNVAVVTEGAARLAGWEIYGHLILGRELETGANVTVIHGTATVGANQAGSSTGVTQGGAQIVVPDNSDQMYLPNCDSTPPVLPGDARVLWTRYL